MKKRLYEPKNLQKLSYQIEQKIWKLKQEKKGLLGKVKKIFK